MHDPALCFLTLKREKFLLLLFSLLPGKREREEHGSSLESNKQSRKKSKNKKNKPQVQYEYYG
jgi:hypothetical protein